MKHNFNIADFFNALEKFKTIIARLRQTMNADEVDRERLNTVMNIAKKDIEEMFGKIGKGE